MTAWVDLESSMVSEIKAGGEIKYHMISPIVEPKQTSSKIKLETLK